MAKSGAKAAARMFPPALEVDEVEAVEALAEQQDKAVQFFFHRDRSGRLYCTRAVVID